MLFHVLVYSFRNDAKITSSSQIDGKWSRQFLYQTQVPLVYSMPYLLLVAQLLLGKLTLTCISRSLSPKAWQEMFRVTKCVKGKVNATHMHVCCSYIAQSYNDFLSVFHYRLGIHTKLLMYWKSWILYLKIIWEYFIH